MTWLSGYSKRIELTIDSSKIDEDLTNYPVAILLNDSSGINNADTTGVITDLVPTTTVSGFVGDGVKFYANESWSINALSAVGNMRLVNNKLNQSFTNASSGVQTQVWSKFLLRGDFDIQVRLSDVNINRVSTNFLSYFFQLTDVSNSSNYLYIAEYFDPAELNYRIYSKINYLSTTIVQSYVTSSVITPVIFRFKRTGILVEIFYNLSGSWVAYGSASWVASDVQISLHTYVYGYTTSAASASWDNLNITSGRIIWAKNYTYYKKMALTTVSGVQCYMEVQDWSQEDKKSIIWAKVPFVSAEEDTKLYLYYDPNQSSNLDYVGDRQELAGNKVWDDNFLVVYHMCEAPNNNVLNSKNSYVYSIPTNMQSTDLVDTNLGKGLWFDGSSEFMYNPDHTSLATVNGISLEVYFKINSDYSTGHHGLVTKLPNSGSNPLWFLQIHSSNSGEGKVFYGFVRKSSEDLSVVAGGNFNWSTSTWYYMAMTYDKSNLIMYKDGISFGASVPHTEDLVVSTNSFVVGAAWWGGSLLYSDVVIDEFRMSSVGRSAAWIKATQHTMTDDLISFSDPQTRSVFSFNGDLLVDSSPASRVVRLHRRIDGEIVDTVAADINGHFEVESPYSGEEHYIVILPNEDDTFNAFVYDKLISGG